MSIEKRRNGYTVRWRDAAGVARSRQVSLWRDAVTLDGEIKRKKAMGELIDHERGTIRLDDFWALWCSRATVSPRTLTTYSHLWRKHIAPVLGSRRLRDVDRESIDALVARLNDVLAPASVRQCLAVLQGVLERAVEWRYIGTNPARGVKKPKLVKRRGRALNVTEVEALCKELDLRSATIVRVLAHTGLRPGELRELRWGDVRDPIRVYAPKTNRQRSVSVRPEARKAFTEWAIAEGRPHAGGVVFHAHSGYDRQWTEQGWRMWQRQVFAPAAARAGLAGVVPYDLRHTFVSTLIAEGTNPVTVARQAGHSLAVCLSTYAHEFESVYSECTEPSAQARNTRARLRT